MSHRVRIVLATALAVGATVIGTLSSGTAQAAPPPDLKVTVYVNAPDALPLLGDLTPEFYPVSGEPYTGCAKAPEDPYVSPEGFFGYQGYECPSIPIPGAYQIGLDGAPPTAIVSAECYTTQKPVVDERIDGANTTFTLDGSQTVDCYIYVDVPAVIIDKTIVDGPASVADFDIEIYADPDVPGGPDAGALVATTSDPDAANCYLGDIADCAVVLLDPGSYQLGEIPALGYLATNVYCVPVFAGNIGERFPGTAGTFTLGGGFLQKETLSEIQIQPQSPFAYCEIENSYFEGDIVVEKVVVNDDGGTATEADFTAEVYLESDGSLATEAECAADGSCIDEALAIGEYRVGESGPSGYTATVVCEVTVEPDTPTLGTVVPTLPPWVQPNEALSGGAALFELEPFGEVTCVITNNDNPVPTTAPTTTAPTTTDQAQVPPQLPATGGDSDSLGLIAALGALMLLMGGTLLVARRRT
jgi:LPXTG-motif cell wall-anchored protein